MSSSSVTLAAPNLAPERQQGWDAGVDAVFGPGSLSVTYYDQTAENLIQDVLLQATPIQTDQFQNVGRVKNTGVEVEGRLSVGWARLTAQYGYTRSRVEDLGPNYSGDVRVGDQVLFTPKHTAGASLTLLPLRGTSLSAGLTYVGSHTIYDIIALNRCFAGTGPCQPGPGIRGYTVLYPGSVKLNATLSREFTPAVSGFVSVDNLTNNTTPELRTGSLVMGRITTFGLRTHF